MLLALLQGVDGKLKNHPDKIVNIKELVQSKVVCASFEKSPFGSTPVTNGTPAKRKRAKSYAAGMIFHKKYTSFSLPESSSLEADLKEIIHIYSEVKKLKVK